MPIETLKKQGLTEKEAGCYLATLQVQNGSASTIARKAQLKRLTAYNALQSLVKKGIASSYQHKGVTHYCVIGPELLVNKIETDLRQKIKNIKSILPTMKGLTQYTNQQTNMQYYHGVEGLKTLHELFLQSPYLYNLIAAGDNMDKELLRYTYEEHIPQRVKLGIDIKIMLTPTAYDRYVAYHQENNLYINLEQTKKIHSDERECEHDIMLFGDNKVAMVNKGYNSQSAIVFSHPAFYLLCKNMMDLVRSNF